MTSFVVIVLSLTTDELLFVNNTLFTRLYKTKLIFSFVFKKLIQF